MVAEVAVVSHIVLVVHVLLVVASVVDVHDHVGKLSLCANEVEEVVVEDLRGLWGSRASGHGE